MRRDREAGSIVVDGIEETHVLGNLGKEAPSPHTTQGAQQERSERSDLRRLCRRQGPGPSHGPWPQPDPGLARAYSGLDLETSNVQRGPPPAPLRNCHSSQTAKTRAL